MAGVFFLNKGYSLKRTYKLPKLEGSILPIIAVVLLVFLLTAPVFIHFTESASAPGGKHAALAISLVAGIIVGMLAQRTRFMYGWWHKRYNFIWSIKIIIRLYCYFSECVYLQFNTYKYHRCIIFLI